MKNYVEMVKNGITYVSESSSGNCPDKVAEGIRKVGLRGLVDTYDNIHDYFNKENDQILYGTHLLEEEDITDETLADCMKKKDKYNSTLFLTHCMENDWRKDLVYTNYQKSSVQLYKERNLLDDKTILYHGVHLNDEDLTTLSSSGSTVVHCPVSNFWTGAGIAPVKQMLEKGVNVCIGTDFSSVDIWESMKISYFLLKNNTPVSQFTAEDIFKMVTINAAKAYHQTFLGSVKNGYDADLVFIKKDPLIASIHLKEFSTILHNLLMETRSDKIQHVMVQGQWIMYNQNLLMVSEEDINEKYLRIVDKVFL